MKPFDPRAFAREVVAAVFADDEPTAYTPPGTHGAPAAPDHVADTSNMIPTLRLGMIADRLGMGITEGFLASIGFAPAARDKAARLYHEADFPRMCAAIAEHVLRVGGAA